MASTGKWEEERLADEALQWLIRLQEQPESAVLRAGFHAWLAEGPGQAAAWAEAQHLWGLLGEVRAHRSVPMAVEQAPPASLRAPRRLGRRAFFGAVAVAAAASAAFFALPGLRLRLQADHVTGTGQTATLRLEDGSLVHLAPDSGLDILADSAGRSVRLLWGEAFFEVVTDAARPFAVAAGALKATVLGTAFNVRLAEAGAAVAVREGLVAVTYGQGDAPEARLGMGEWLRVDGQGRVVARGSMASDEVAAWLKGRLVVKNQSIADVVEDLRRYYSGRILLADEGLARRTVTGVYDLADPVAALRALVHPHRGTVREALPSLLVVSAG